MPVITWIIIFIASIFFLVQAADYFTDYAERLGKILRMPTFVVGVIIVALGTSLPELATSIASVYSGESQMVASNIIGTIIANVLLGLGIASVLTKRIIRFDWDLISNDMPIFIAAVIFTIITMADGKFTLTEAFVMLLGYLIYLLYTAGLHKNHKLDLDGVPRVKMTIKIPIMLVLSLIVIFIAAHYTVESVIEIAHIFGLGTSALAASVVAVGTSLPEIMVAVSAARKGKFDMVIGDIMGSNIFDLLAVLGTAGLFGTLLIDTTMIWLGLPVLAGMAILQWIIMVDKKLTRVEGLLLILTYVLFLGKLFNFI